jgi:predicted Zn-dependent protease
VADETIENPKVSTDRKASIRELARTLFAMNHGKPEQCIKSAVAFEDAFAKYEIPPAPVAEPPPVEGEIPDATPEEKAQEDADEVKAQAKRAEKEEEHGRRRKS